MRFSSAILLSAFFLFSSLTYSQGFDQETTAFTDLFACDSPYIADAEVGITYSTGRQYECHGGQLGDNNTVDFFLTESDDEYNVVEKAMFRWKQHSEAYEKYGFKYRANSGRELSEQWLSKILKRYSPAESSLIKRMFFGQANNQISTGKYTFKFFLSGSKGEFQTRILRIIYNK